MPFQFRKESIEEDLNSNFPSQGQGNPPLYYQLSEVVVPTYSINAAADGSNLGENLQTAWDFSTGHATTSNTTSNLITNTGFWKVQANFVGWVNAGVALEAYLQITDGITAKEIWRVDMPVASNSSYATLDSENLVVFLRSGDTLQAVTDSQYMILNTVYRQIATVNGTLVNPLGFSAA